MSPALRLLAGSRGIANGRNSYQLNAGHHRFPTHRTACLKKTFRLHTRSDGPLVCRDNFLLVWSSKEHTSVQSATSLRHAWTSTLMVGDGSRRLYPDFGQRWIRTSQGNSAYHAMQWRAERRFARGFQVASSYTWSKNMDSTSEGIGNVNTQYSNMNLTSVPIQDGGMKLDRALSDFHRSHRLTISSLWEVPGPFGNLESRVRRVVARRHCVISVRRAVHRCQRLRQKCRWRHHRRPSGHRQSERPIEYPRYHSYVCNSGYSNPDTAQYNCLR